MEKGATQRTRPDFGDVLSTPNGAGLGEAPHSSPQTVGPLSVRALGFTHPKIFTYGLQVKGKG